MGIPSAPLDTLFKAQELQGEVLKRIRLTGSGGWREFRRMLFDNGYCRISSLNEVDQSFIEKYITMALASPSLILSWCFYFVRAKRPLEPDRVFRTLASVFGVQALTWLSCHQLGVDWSPMPGNKRDLEALENMETPRGHPIPL